MSGLTRDVLKWIQSLDLTLQIKTPKWDMTNGYLVAEIFSWYHPREIEMHMFNNGTSLESKLKNWSLLTNFFKRHKLDIPEEFIEGTIHCREGAAVLLVERIYEVLTNRQVSKVPEQYDVDFTDRAYQAKLPMHARSTAAQAVKNNLRVTELMADKSIILGQQKASSLISQHLEHRREEREEDPERFGIKPTLGELAIRRPPPPEAYDTQMSMATNASEPKERRTSKGGEKPAFSREPTVQFKEIEVQQMDRSGAA